MYSAEVDGDRLRQTVSAVFSQHLPDCLFENLPTEQQRAAQSLATSIEGNILSVFRRDDLTWTMLTDTHLVSSTNGSCISIALAALNSDYEIAGSSDQKQDLMLVRFKASPQQIWAPSAEHASMLLHVLQIVFRRNEGR